MTFAEVKSVTDTLPPNEKLKLELYLRAKRHGENTEYQQEMNRRVVEMQKRESFSSKTVRDLNNSLLEKGL